MPRCTQEPVRRRLGSGLSCLTLGLKPVHQEGKELIVVESDDEVTALRNKGSRSSTTTCREAT
jgi:hypothetical protein